MVETHLLSFSPLRGPTVQLGPCALCVLAHLHPPTHLLRPRSPPPRPRRPRCATGESAAAAQRDAAAPQQTAASHAGQICSSATHRLVRSPPRRMPAALPRASSSSQQLLLACACPRIVKPSLVVGSCKPKIAAGSFYRGERGSVLPVIGYYPVPVDCSPHTTHY